MINQTVPYVCRLQGDLNLPIDQLSEDVVEVVQDVPGKMDTFVEEVVDSCDSSWVLHHFHSLNVAVLRTSKLIRKLSFRGDM